MQVIAPYVVARTLSVMTSSGMYDYAGEWIYRVGIPAKSGVGGGIVAALPSQIGLGTFSPRLDSHGNSVRGLKVCEALSSRFDLHMLNRSADVRTCIIADYDIFGISSRRSRQPHEQQILDEHHSDIRVIELVGALNFAAIDYVTRRLASEPPNAPLLILDFRRVPDLTAAGAQLLGENLTILGNAGVTAILTGHRSDFGGMAGDPRAHRRAAQAAALRAARRRDRMGRGPDHLSAMAASPSSKETSHLGEQALLAELTAEEIAALADLSTARRYEAGQRIISAGEPANSLFFLQSGMVSVKLPSGVRLASLGPGMEFGEMAIIEAEAQRRCLGRHAGQMPRTAARQLCRLPPAPPADRDEDHAQSVRAAGAASDPRQRQGRSAQRVLDPGTECRHRSPRWAHDRVCCVVSQRPCGCESATEPE